MTKHIMTSVTLAGILFAGGCATKKYVAKTVDPVRDKVDSVGAQSDKQGQTIAQQGTQIGQQGDQIKKQGSDIEQAQTDIAANKERAVSADKRATEAIAKSEVNTKDLAELRQVVGNLMITNQLGMRWFLSDSIKIRLHQTLKQNWTSWSRISRLQSGTLLQ